ncbi:MAG: N-formylglutamate amidohydrolase [Pseudomonadota bacterium]
MSAALDAIPALLAPDEPPACKVYNPQGAAPLLIVADHASNRIPRALDGLGIDPAYLDTHIAVDMGSAAVARRLADRLDATLVQAGYSRLVIDLNRGLTDPTGVPEVSDGVPVPGNCDLTAAQRQQRVHEIFLPYRRTIDAQLHRIRATGVVPAFIAIHSFTPIMANQRRPWQVGVLWDKDPRLPVPLLRRLREHADGLTVGDNEPYSGRHPADYTVDHHAEAAGLPHVSIEVRQDLLHTSADCLHWADLLHDAFEPILADPNLYTLWQGH